VIPLGAPSARETPVTTRPAELSSRTATQHDVDPTEVRPMTHESAGYMLAGG